MTTKLSKQVLCDRMNTTPQALASLCRRWKISELALFGSVLREDFKADSDIDILVSYQANASRGLFQKMALKEEFEALICRKVDLVSKKAIQESRNWVRRENILNSAEIVYVA